MTWLVIAKNLLHFTF